MNGGAAAVGVSRGEFQGAIADLGEADGGCRVRYGAGEIEGGGVAVGDAAVDHVEDEVLRSVEITAQHQRVRREGGVGEGDVASAGEIEVLRRGAGEGAEVDTSRDAACI